MFQDFSLRSTTATFVYLPHFAVVSQFETALLRPRAACRAVPRATPPKKRGVMRPRVGVQCGTPSRVSQGVALVGIYPCGKAQEPDKSERRECPLSLSPNDLGSVFAVKGSALPRSAP